MAVYYKWIKGCGTNAQKDILKDATWTYLNWSNIKPIKEDNTTTIDYTYELSPSLSISYGKDISPISLGYILTNDITGVTIKQPWRFNKEITIKDPNNTESSVIIHDTKITCATTMAENTPSYSLNIDGHLSTPSFSTTSLLAEEVNISTTLKAGITTINPLKTTDITREPILIVNGIVEIDGKCEATYFNAKSDKRAKENIKPLNFSALDLVKNLPVYTFNYKNDTQTVPGILAQDLLERQPDTISLVDNKEASGENGDYMSIKSDKLIYILLAAIQEQQAEIDALKQQLQTK